MMENDRYGFISIIIRVEESVNISLFCIAIAQVIKKSLPASTNLQKTI